MINLYNIYSKDIFYNKYAVWKNVLRTEFMLPIINKEVIIEYHFCAFVDLLKKDDYSNNVGNFDSIKDYNSFLKKDLENFEEHNVDEFYFCGYPESLEDAELNFFVSNFLGNQSGYLYTKVFDKETKNRLPDYYVLLWNYNDRKDPFKGLEIPETEQKMQEILFENQLNRMISSYECDRVLSFDSPYNAVLFGLQDVIIKYFNEGIIDIKNLNYVYDEIFSIKDFGIRKYSIYIFSSITTELEFKKLCKTCKTCNKIFEYNDTKKYCSEKCKIKAKNKRQYQNRKIKNIT